MAVAAVANSRQLSLDLERKLLEPSGGIGSTPVAAAASQSTSSLQEPQSRSRTPYMDRFHRVFLGAPTNGAGNKAASTSAASLNQYPRTDGVTMFPANTHSAIRPSSPYSNQSSASSVTSVHNMGTLHRTASGSSRGRSSTNVFASRGTQKQGYNSSNGMTRQRSRTEGMGTASRNGSQGGIGESPMRSRQNSSSSSVGSGHNSIFTHRQSSSTATQDLAAQTGSKHSTLSGPTALLSNGKTGNTLPSIRGYTTFPDQQQQQQPNRPRTPLSEPFGSTRSTGPPPQILSDLSDPNEGQSYVASLGLAPLITRPPNGGGGPVYIPAGRSSSPQLRPLAPHGHGRGMGMAQGQGQTPQQLPSVFDSSPNPAAQPAMFPIAAATTATARRPTIRQRSSSHNSYLRRSQDRNDRHDRQNSNTTGTARTSRSRPNSRGTSNSKSKSRIGNRFIRYEESIGSSPRNRSTSFGAGTTAGTTGSRTTGGGQQPDWSPQAANSTPGIGATLEQQTSRGSSRGRRSRSRNRFRSGGNDSSTSVDRRTEDRKGRKKLISARLPNGQNHRDARLPSQPLGLTWVCGARLVARHPSFYEDFEYAEYPGGRRKRSSSRSTITPTSYRQSREDQEGIPGSATTVGGYESEPEQLRRARQASVDQYRELHASPAMMQQQQSQQQQQQTATAPIMVMSPSEQALRRRSQSLTNLRRNATAADKGGLLISAPISPRQHSGEFMRAPRAAPSPYGSSDGHSNNGSSPNFVSAPTMQVSNSRGGGPAATARSTSLRKTPSKASVEAIEDPEKRREALFAALPPPARRSPNTASSPLQGLSPSMFSTGRVISSNVPQVHHSHQDSTAVSTEGVLDGFADDSNNGGNDSPTMEDIRDLEASRVILGESVLSPVMYGMAFSDDAPQSEEGEIVEDPSSGSIPRIRQSPPTNASHEDVNERGLRLGQGEGRTYSDSSIAQRSQNSSRSLEDAPSASSVSSARVLDLHDDSFTNLFYKAPPPSKPLPSVPSSDSASASASLSGASGSQRYSPVQATRHYLGVRPPSESLVRRAGSASPERSLSGLPPPAAAGFTRRDEEEEGMGDRRASELSMDTGARFSTPSIFNNPLFQSTAAAVDEGAGDQDGNKSETSSMSEREIIAHPAGSAIAGSRQPAMDDAWINVDEGLLRGNRRMWLGSQASDEDDAEEDQEQEFIRPRMVSRGMTVSTEGDSSNYYSVPASANASTAALTEGSSHVLQHMPSFISARSHLTATASAAPTVQGDTPGYERQFDFMSPQQQQQQGEEAGLATLRRTDISPIYAQRPSLPEQYTGQQQAPAPVARVGGTSADQQNRESFIDFEAEQPLQTMNKLKRASVDNHSFIDDDDSEDEDVGTRHGLKPEPLVLSQENSNRPSVVIEQAPEDETGNDNTIQHGYALSPSRSSPLTPASPTESAYSDVDFNGARHSEILDQYPRVPGGQPFRGSYGDFPLGVPASPHGRQDRNSAASHAHSVSNASFLSRLGDFPPPPSGAVNASDSSLELDVDLVAGSTRTLGRLGAEDTRRHTGESFLDTSASPERSGSRYSAGVPSLQSQSHIAFSTGPNSPTSPASPALPSSSSPPSTPSFRLSGLFGRRNPHERTSSDPSSVGASISVGMYTRGESGGLNSQDERRQSWRS